jgi:ATP-binding cassette subfamily B protein
MTSEQFPYFKQADVVGCGPACLQMIAKYYGKEYSFSMLSEICGMTEQGTSLLGMTEAAEHIGFNTLSIKTTLEEMRAEELFPCVAFCLQKHFVVVYKIEKEKVFVADPVQGLVEYPPDKFIQLWAIPGDEARRGIVLLLEPK